MNYREQFEKETDTRWTNSQGEPDIDYVEWLESELSKRDVAIQERCLPCQSRTKIYLDGGKEEEFCMSTNCPLKPYRSEK